MARSLRHRTISFVTFSSQENTMPRNTTAKSTNKTSKPHRSASRASATDALHLLADDHKKVAELVDEFESAKEKGDEEAMQMLVETTCAELTIHAQVEEDVFYPAVRDAIDDMDLLDEAEVEHGTARQLITELAAMQPDDDLYNAKFTVLGEYVKHHIHEEEKELFPKVKKANIDLQELGAEIRRRKMELHEELGVPPEDEADFDDIDAGGPTRRPLH
jgi:hemerythrin superfamily protein